MVTFFAQAQLSESVPQPHPGIRSFWSPEYITMPNIIWRLLLRSVVSWARFFAWDNAGNSIAARIAMIAITTSNSIRVKARSETEDNGRVFMVLRSYLMKLTISLHRVNTACTRSGTGALLNRQSSRNGVGR